MKNRGTSKSKRCLACPRRRMQMSDALERFVNWKRELNRKLWPLPLLSPIYDAGLLLGVFKVPAQPYLPPHLQPQYRQPFSQPQPAPQLHYHPPQTGFQQPSPYGMGACPNCGSPFQPYVNFCDRCGTHIR